MTVFFFLFIKGPLISSFPLALCACIFVLCCKCFLHVLFHVMMYHVCIVLLCTHVLYLKHKVLLSFSVNPETKDRVTVDHTEKKNTKKYLNSNVKVLELYDEVGKFFEELKAKCTSSLSCDLMYYLLSL